MKLILSPLLFLDARSVYFKLAPQDPILSHPPSTPPSLIASSLFLQYLIDTALIAESSLLIARFSIIRESVFLERSTLLQLFAIMLQFSISFFIAAMLLLLAVIFR